MRRRKPLRARTPLQRKKELRATKALVPSKKPLKRTPLARGLWNRNEWERFDAKMRAAHAAWRASVVKARCANCVDLGHKVDRHSKRDPHHVLPARFIRRYVRAMRLPADEAARLLRSLLYDIRNGICLCRACHEEHENAKRPIPRRLLPPGAWQFARELRLTHVLELLYPE